MFVLCLRDSDDCLVFGVVSTSSLTLNWCSGMDTDGFSKLRRKRGSWIPGKERAERVLASAISIDGRKEWTSKFCSESNVGTRWRCRRCCSDILAGLRGKHRQAVAARSGEWSAGSTTSSGEEDGKTRSLEAENKELPSKD